MPAGPNTYLASFRLKDADPVWSSGKITPGSGYSVAETVPDGWDRTSAVCDDGSAIDAITLSPGEVVKSTFTNTKRGELVVDKVTDPAGAADSFPFTVSGGAGTSAVAPFSLTDAAAPHHSGRSSRVVHDH